MATKNQSKRLTSQHKRAHGVIGIFGNEAKSHDFNVGQVAQLVLLRLREEFPQL